MWVTNLSCSGPAAASWCRSAISLIISCDTCPCLSSAFLADTSAKPTWLKVAQKPPSRQARSLEQLTDLLVGAFFMTMQSHEHGACSTAGKCFCTALFQTKVSQPTGPQFNMLLRNVPCLQMEGGAGVCQLWDCSERQNIAHSETPYPLQSCRSVQQLLHQCRHQWKKCWMMQSCLPCHVPAWLA